MRKYFIHIIGILYCLLFINKCSSGTKIQTFSLRNDSNQASFLEQVQTLQINAIDTNKLDKAGKELWQIVENVLQSDFYLVERKSKQVLNSEVNNPFRSEYMRFLTYSLFFQSKWSELLPERNSYYYDPDSVFLIAKAFAKVDSQSVYFSKDADTVEFEIAPNGAIVVKVSINGKMRNFWFDTGTNYTIVSSKTAEDCNLPILSKESSRAITHTDYKVDVRPAYIQALKFGNMEIMNHPCLIVDDFNLKLHLFASNTPVEIYGIFGWKAIQNAKFTIDYEKRKIIIDRPRKREKSVGNFFWFGIPIIIGEFQNQKILFAFDLGSEKSYLTNNIFKRINFQKIYQQTKGIGSVGGWKFNPTLVVPYFEVNIDTFRIVFVDIGTFDLARNLFFQIDGILGLDFVKKAKITFDIANSKFTILERY